MVDDVKCLHQRLKINDNMSDKNGV